MLVTVFVLATGNLLGTIVKVCLGARSRPCCLRARMHGGASYVPAATQTLQSPALQGLSGFGGAIINILVWVLGKAVGLDAGARCGWAQPFAQPRVLAMACSFARWHSAHNSVQSALPLCSLLPARRLANNMSHMQAPCSRR